MDKARRDELRSQLESINWPTADITKSELRALIDGYERRWQILREARKSIPNTEPTLQARIDAELEGDHDN